MFQVDGQVKRQKEDREGGEFSSNEDDCATCFSRTSTSSLDYGDEDEEEGETGRVVFY